MDKYIAGEVNDDGTKWHKLDEAGPDLEAQQLAQGGTIHKSNCGNHYGTDPVTEYTEAFPLCEDCF